MRILAFETSGQAGSVALLEGIGDAARLICEAAIGEGQRTAQALAPLTKGLLQEADWPANSIELVAVAVGPGSFTGLRIGVTMAKTFAYAVGAQVLGVNTLEIIAEQTRENAEQAAERAAPLWSVMDAQRQELFAAKFAAGNDSPRIKMVSDTRIMTQAAWLAALEPGDHVTGPGLRRLATSLPANVVALDESVWQPSATTVGQLGWRQFQAGRRDDLWKLSPIYYRPSAAEEKANIRPSSL